MARKLGCLLVVLFAGTSVFAAGVGAISGTVKDGSGTRFYSAENLLPGTYQIKVTAASFLPSLRENVSLRAGGRVLVNVTLNTLADALLLLPGRRSLNTEPDDWHWTLRSAANRPILRVVNKDKHKDDDGKRDTGRPQVALSGEKLDDRAIKARVAFIAGSEAGGFGSAGDMTTSFSLEKSMFAAGTLALDGNIGASSGDPAGVLRASYSYNFGPSSHPTFTVTYRRFASPGAAVENSPYAAVEMNISDSMSVAEVIDLQYGAAVQSLEFAKRITALRPYFDSAPADLSESGPRMALANGVPNVERAHHQEISASRRFGKTSVQVAGYMDHVRNAVLTGAGDPSSYSDDVLPDVYSGTFSYAYSGSLSTTGTRVVVERKISHDLNATVDYSTGGAVSAESLPHVWQNLAQSLAATRQHSVATKFSGYIPVSGTRWIASYKWTSGNTLSPVDAFNASPGQADPYVSIFIRQPLPGTSFMPGKMDALVDLRNLLAQGYLPIMGPDGRTVYLVQSARALRAGLAFTF